MVYGAPRDPARSRDGVTVLDAAVFLAELVLLAVTAVAGWRLGSFGVVRVVLAVGLPLAAATAWGIWLAPNAVMRLGFLTRLMVKIDLFLVAAVLLGLSGAVSWAVGFAVVALAPVVGHEVLDRRREPRVRGT